MNPETASGITQEELAIVDQAFAEITRELEKEIVKAGPLAKT